MMYNQANIDAWRIAAKEDTRPEIASVLLTKTKTVATDSFKLIEVDAPEGTGDIEDYPAKSMRGMDPVLVDSRALRTVKIKDNRQLPQLSNMTVKHVDKDTVELNVPTGASDGTQPLTEVRKFSRIQGQFPDYQRIIPKTKPVVEATVNVDYLMDLLKVLKKANATHDKSNKKVTIRLWGKLEPVEVVNTNEQQRARALLMPIQGK